MADFTQDIRYALRQIPRSPGFFTVAALLIAIGLAATTQIFTLVNALLLRPLPVRDPQNLIQLFEQQPKRPADLYFDYRFYTQLSRQSSTLFEFAGQIDNTRALERNGHAERVHAVAVTESFFSSLGVPPLLGRVLGRNDDHRAVLSYACWSRSFGRDPKVLGQVVTLQGHNYTIVGVMPQGFTGTTVDSSPDLWVPFANLFDFFQRPHTSLDHAAIEIIARLRPWVSEAQAQQETETLWNRYVRDADLENPVDRGDLKRGRMEVRSIARGVSTLRVQSRTSLLLLLAGTGLLLLIVCANVGALMLARVIAHEREIAIRIALGASRLRIMRQWLVESVLLTLIGGCAGVLIAYASLPALMRWMPPAHGIGFDPGEIRILALRPSLDERVVGFSLAAFVFTALLCGLAPAWRSWRSNISLTLKSTSGAARGSFFPAVLCGMQIALCTTLLVSAGLIIRSLSNLRGTARGFDRDRVTVFSIDPHVRGYDGPKIWSMQQRLAKEAQNLPGVEGAAIAYRGLMRGIGLGTSVVFPGQRGDGIVNSSLNFVTPEYFGVMGIHLIAGRNFGPLDVADEDRVTSVVVNEAFVRQFLNNRNPLGEKFATGRQFVKPQYDIIGVVSDAKYRSLREVPPPILYTYNFGPNAYPDTFILHVRSRGDPHTIIEPVRKLMRSIDPELPLYQVATLSEEVDNSLWQERLLATLTSCFGGVALMLASIGLYGIMAHFVARRQREIGLHMALGANTQDVIRLVVRRVIPMLMIGVLAGVTMSALASAWLRSLLYGVQPLDPLTDIASIMLLITIGSGAAILPAFRAIHVDPASTLRQD